MIRQGIIIPVYNHGAAAEKVVEKLAPLGVPVIIVDDGSDDETKAHIAKISAAHPETISVVLEKNSGKGRAFGAGIQKAREIGLTHVLQIDADGQHDAGRACFFLDESALHPGALICSYPEYDESVPAIRKRGRVVANTWAKIVTLCPDIPESMLGFRVYPVEPVFQLYRKAYIDSRMGFDIDILVRLYWKGLPLIFHPVAVTYPIDGISHFRPVRDNIRISLTYTRLCCGMLLRLPMLAARGISRRARRPRLMP
ncbi:MAG: glycosyltransferase family 2 protein [Treponema sp.]|nr:glycosyltransferase family 2 protein [Treponema sp.]